MKNLKRTYVSPTIVVNNILVEDIISNSSIVNRIGFDTAKDNDSSIKLDYNDSDTREIYG